MRRVVLIGMPGSGKSTVGAALARALGWAFHDVDAEIVRRTRRSIAELFQAEGEAAFRAMESRLTAELCSLSDVVLAPGGGWAATPGSLEALSPDTATVWLRISPDEAMARLRGSPPVRPLIAGPDPLGALQRLAERREERYARAHLVVDVDQRRVDDIVRTIAEWLRSNIS